MSTSPVTSANPAAVTAPETLYPLGGGAFLKISKLLPGSDAFWLS